MCKRTQLLWTDSGEVMKQTLKFDFEIVLTFFVFALLGSTEVLVVKLGFWNSEHLALKLSICT